MADESRRWAVEFDLAMDRLSSATSRYTAADVLALAATTTWTPAQMATWLYWQAIEERPDT